MIEKTELVYKEVGYKFVTRSRMITSADCDIFVAIAGPREDILISDEIAKAKGFKRKVVALSLALGIAWGLIFEEGLTPEATTLGVEELRFPAPLYPYDTVRVEGEVIGKRESSKGDRIIVTYSWVLKNQDDAVVAQAEIAEMFAKPKEL